MMGVLLGRLERKFSEGIDRTKKVTIKSTLEVTLGGISLFPLPVEV